MSIILKPETPASPASQLKGEGRGIVAQPLGEFRMAAARQSSSNLKAAVLRIQQAINAMDFSKVKDVEEMTANQTALEALLRRQAILIAVLTSRSKHGGREAQEMHDWLEKEAKVKRAF